MPIIRKKLIASEVYPDDIRYNPDTDTVESLVNGEWVENPSADPRTQTTLPPRLTSDTPCDAAQSVVDALKGQIDDILTAIDNGATAFTIAGFILGLLSFGVFAIFISIALAIADAMLSAGTGALTAALTNPVYEQLRCILLCHMDGQGRLDAGSLPTVQADVDAQIGGLAATILNSMLALAGEGGINNLASLGTSTGDCTECDYCTPCIDESNILIGTYVSQGVNSITIEAVLTTYETITAYWVVYGSNNNAFCCTLCSQVWTPDIDTGSWYDCGGVHQPAVSPINNLVRRIKFQRAAAGFQITFGFVEGAC